MTNTRDDGTADGGIPERVHARIQNWTIFERRAPDGEPTCHVVGMIVAHARLSPSGESAGGAHIGSPLAALDLHARHAVNARGKLVLLEGDPLTHGDLPDDYDAMLCWAEVAWALPRGTTWHRFA